MTEYEVQMLATYNAECARGIVHTEDWHSKMIYLQVRFDQELGDSLRYRPRGD